MENEQEATVETVEVNIGAVAMVCRVIAACTERGAIKAEEMSTVGQVFDYMRAFLPAPEATAEGEEGAEVSAEEETAEAESDILEPAKG
jgi:hypothetical protein